ncbi:MAG: valine--tRNA ligase [Hyphomicrobiaceae bacterium]|nr:valine--tRNA ligase [Hyphomicrobiaceae bacterium]
MLEKTYQPAAIEARIHEEWVKAEAFKAGRPERKDAAAYAIVIPPPNVTGSLHMGHALNNTLQDILCRFERMRGRDVLWQPGTDHAGIATQMVVERQLMERQEPDRRKLGRDKFLERVWAWKAESGGTITNQLKRLGASCDWSRERFTMGERGAPDDQMVKAVTKVFVDLYNQGLIYKDKRLVNWDPQFQSAISDLEVEAIEKTGTFKWTRGDTDKEGNPVALDHKRLAKLLVKEPAGHMYYFNYPLEGAAYDPDKPETFVTVATTRPETMLGDTAVAVHPTHEKSRYKHLIGKRVVLPLTGRTIPIVGDDYADPEKGTGAVKITPAHDFNDFEVGRRHADKLVAPINIFDAFAKLNENVPETYRGLERFQARMRVVEDLDAASYVAKIEPTTHTVPHGDRSGVPIEPWLTDQWYVNAGELAKAALAAVSSGKTRFVPERFAADYFRWLENIQPWCVSRQLWWGHQIPAWYGPDGQVFVATSQDEAQALAEKHYASSPSPRVRGEGRGEGQLPVSTGRGDEVPLWRDPDVLDTWFSSALWPFSTLGWPESTPELARYYPTSALVTGFDIIFFWVARMMMMGCHFMQEIPFHDVYIHGLVRDEKGQKMSKSKGNVVDPLKLIEEFGADALRFSMAAMASQGSDVKFSVKRIEGYRNFATKLWNAARFAEMNECVRQKDFDPAKVKGTLNRWIAGEVERTAQAVTAAIEAYKFNEAAGAVYDFTWGTFCDWYLELAKPILNGEDEAGKAETRATAAWALDQVLKLLHPFMPFITEELWERVVEVGEKRTSLLCLSPWPRYAGLADAAADEEIGWVVRLVSEVRSVRSEMNVPAGAKVPLVLVGAGRAVRARADRHGDIIRRLARIDAITFEAAAPKGSAQIVVGETTAALPLAGVIDMGAERTRLLREIDKAAAEIRKIDAKLSNQSFVAKAPPEVVEENRERKADFEAVTAKLQAALKRVEAA